MNQKWSVEESAAVFCLSEAILWMFLSGRWTTCKEMLHYTRLCPVRGSSESWPAELRPVWPLRQKDAVITFQVEENWVLNKQTENSCLLICSAPTTVCKTFVVYLITNRTFKYHLKRCITFGSNQCQDLFQNWSKEVFPFCLFLLPEGGSSDSKLEKFEPAQPEQVLSYPPEPQRVAQTCGNRDRTVYNSPALQASVPLETKPLHEQLSQLIKLSRCLLCWSACMICLSW